MFKCIKKLRKYNRVMDKIRSKLPICTPDGDRIDWNIFIYYENEIFDIYTGKIISRNRIPTIHISQSPSLCSGSHRVWKFNWKKKELNLYGGQWR